MPNTVPFCLCTSFVVQTFQLYIHFCKSSVHSKYKYNNPRALVKCTPPSPPLQVDKVVLKILSRFNQQIHGQSVLSAYLQVKHLLKTSIFKKARCSETYLIISFKGRVLNKNK